MLTYSNINDQYLLNLESINSYSTNISFKKSNLNLKIAQHSKNHPANPISFIGVKTELLFCSIVTVHWDVH